jgi:hypothetical protein
VQQPIGNIGAWPVYSRPEDIPPELQWPGMRFAVPSAEGFDVYEVRVGASAQGLSGFWSSLIQVGGLIAAPFTGGASIPFAQAGAGLVGQVEAKGAQEKQIGAQFDQLAGEVTRLFDSIQQKPTITAADAAQAQQAYAQLASIAQQYGSIEFVSRKWSSDAYRPAYEQRLQQIIQAARAAGAGGSSQTTGTATEETTGGGDNSTLLIVGAVALLLFLKMRRGQG